MAYCVICKYMCLNRKLLSKAKILKGYESPTILLHPLGKNATAWPRAQQSDYIPWGKMPQHSQDLGLHVIVDKIKSKSHRTRVRLWQASMVLSASLNLGHDLRTDFRCGQNCSMTGLNIFAAVRSQLSQICPLLKCQI